MRIRETLGAALLLALTSTAGAEPAPGPTAADQKSEPMKKPRTKAFDHPGPDRLGTLPEGVGVVVGRTAPGFELPDVHGKTVSLASLTAKGPVLVVFYRGGWCPYCNMQIHELSRRAPDFEKLGVQLVAISVDKPDKAAVTQASWTIPFPVLSDPDAKVHAAWNVVHVVPSPVFEKLKAFGMDIEAWSGRKHHKIAIPSVFLVDKEGVVRWAHAERDYKVRPSVDQVLSAIRPVVARR